MATSSSSAPSERVYRSCDVSTSVTIDVSGLHGRFAASEGEKKEVLVGVRILSSSATNSNSNNQENFTELTTVYLHENLFIPKRLRYFPRDDWIPYTSERFALGFSLGVIFS